MDLTVLDNLKAKELRKEYAAFIGDEKNTEYYLKRFDKMGDSGSKLNINIAAFFFSTYWCFYRKLFGPGAIFLLMNFAGLYISLMKPDLATLGSIMVFVPAIVCGLFGNYLYMSYARKNIAVGIEMGYEAKNKHYANNGGTSTRIVLGIIAAFIFFGMALFFSAGPAAIENMQQQSPFIPPAAE